MRLVFLLGAGVSRELLPLGGALTDIVLTGATPDKRPVIRAGDGSYLFGEPGPPPPVYPDYVRQLTPLLGWLKSRMFSGAIGDDYELLFFGLQQIADVLGGEVENPLLKPFLEEYASEVARLGADAASPSMSPSQCAREAANYIAGIVACALSTPVAEADSQTAHRPLLDACIDGGVKSLDIVTLNHDVLLEQSLRAASIAVEDGFEVTSARDRRSREPLPAGVAFWSGFKDPRGRVRLLKLHGSIDWWMLRPDNGDWSEDRVARLGGSHHRLADEGGRWWDALGSLPLMLVGTFNKMLDYTRPFYLQHYAVFRRALLRSDALVVSGYSFRDKAVNGLVADWYYSRQKPGRRLVVVAPGLKPGEPPATARGAIGNKWESWAGAGRLTPIPSPFANVDWPTMKAGLWTR